MTQRGAVIVAAALTAFVLVVAGGVAGRLTKRDGAASAATPVTQPARPPVRALTTARAVERRDVAPRNAVWREHEDDEREHEGDDDD
ncbi:MAG TPA: hypothetical protein VF997_22485 [Polyangia bacterium]